MKKIFKNWSIFEIVLLFSSFVILTICFLFDTDKNFFSYVSSLIGVTAVLTISKGLFFAPILNLIFDVLYGILSLQQRYYGEAIICFALMLPIYLFSIVTWVKNKKCDNSQQVKINIIKAKEHIFICFISVIITVALYFLLKALNTNYLVLSTISLTTSSISAYLMLRRSSYYALGYMANDIVLIIMWGLIVLNSGIGYLTIVINFVVFLVNDAYGLIRWKKEEKSQQYK